LVDHQDATRIKYLGEEPYPPVTDAIAAAILSHWCQTAGTIQAKERLTALEMVCQQLRLRLTATPENSCQTWVPRLVAPIQGEAHMTVLTMQDGDVVNVCIDQPTRPALSHADAPILEQTTPPL